MNYFKYYFFAMLLSSSTLSFAGKDTINVMPRYEHLVLNNGNVNGEIIRIGTMQTNGTVHINSKLFLGNVIVNNGGAVNIRGWDKKKLAITTGIAATALFIGYYIGKCK